MPKRREALGVDENCSFWDECVCVYMCARACVFLKFTAFTWVSEADSSICRLPPSWKVSSIVFWVPGAFSASELELCLPWRDACLLVVTTGRSGRWAAVAQVKEEWVARGFPAFSKMPRLSLATQLQLEDGWHPGDLEKPWVDGICGARSPPRNWGGTPVSGNHCGVSLAGESSWRF